jgi:Tfp pilus assembly protein PilO
MKQSAKRLFSSLLSLAFVIGAFAVFFSLVQPEYAQFVELKAKVQSKQGLLSEQRKTIDEVKKVVATFDNAQNDRIQISLALPTSTLTAEALAQLNSIAVTKHALTAQTYNISAPQEVSTPETTRREPKGTASLVKPVSPVLFQARLLGSYADIKGFLKDLETNVRIFDVKSISIQHAGKPNQDLYNVEVRIAAYYQNK